MYKLLFLFLTMSLSLALQAQVIVDDVDVNSLEHVKYVELLGQQKFLSFKIIVNLDYGQDFKLFRPQRIKGFDGRNMSFNSMIDALNFMEANGWEYVDNYVARTDDANIIHYILRRRKDKDNE